MGTRRRVGAGCRTARQAAAALAAAITLAAGAAGHESTRARHEALLDAREQRLLAAGTALGALGEEKAPPAACRLTLRLTPGPAAGLVRIAGPDGKALPLRGLVNRGIKLRADHPARDWYAVVGAAAVDVPQERLVVEAFSGLETERTVRTVDLRGKRQHRLEVPLRRFAHLGARGWRSGNTHLHLSGLSREQADEYLRVLPRADSLELLFVSYLERAKADHDYISNRYTLEDLHRLGGEGLRFGNGQEHRHNFDPYGEGYGHVMLLNLKRLLHPVSVGPGITGEGPDWPPLRRGITRARADGATVVWCHNDYGFEDTPSWLAGLVDAHNIFDGGHHGSYADTFYRYLNLGLRVPFSTGTDWFLYDFSRVYVRMEGEPAAARWLSALAKGGSFITNGPLLELQVEGREIGETVRLDGPQTVRIRARAAGRSDFQRIELVRNGSVVGSAPSRARGGHFTAELRLELPVDEPGWVALKAAGEGPGSPGAASLGRNELGETLFAHSSPVYLEVAGRSVFQPEAARSFLREMERNLQVISAKARFADAAQRDEVLGLYREAIAGLERRLRAPADPPRPGVRSR